MIYKITNNLENFNYNVIIANIYEIYNFLNREVEKKISISTLEENYKKILTLLCPAIPHFANECLFDLGVEDEFKWPELNTQILQEDKIVIQINGKKRAILNESRDLNQESLLVKIKTNKLSEKYLKNKSITKIIFVKNRLMNLIINE